MLRRWGSLRAELAWWTRIAVRPPVGDDGWVLYLHLSEEVCLLPTYFSFLFALFFQLSLGNSLSNVFELSEEILGSQGSLLPSQPPEVVNH